MPVRVSSDVWDTLGKPEHDDQELIVVLHSQLPLTQAMAAAETAWDAIWYDPTSLLPYYSAIAATAEGPAAWFEERGDARNTLERWAEKLSGAGVADGELRVFHPRHPRLYEQPMPPPMIEARFAVPARDVEDRPFGLWSVDEDVRSALVSRAVSWCYGWGSGDEIGYVDVKMVATMVTRDNAMDVLDAAATISGQSSPSNPARLVVESPSGRFRAAAFELASGYFSVGAGAAAAPEFDVERSLTAVRDAVVSCAPHAVRGFVKLTHSWTPECAHTLDKWDPPSAPWDRGVEETALPDAFGLVLVPTADVARVTPLGPEWRTTDIATNSLLEHSDHSAWYGDLKPDPATVQRAREQLRNIIRLSTPGETTT